MPKITLAQLKVDLEKPEHKEWLADAPQFAIQAVMEDEVKNKATFEDDAYAYWMNILLTKYQEIENEPDSPDDEEFD